ncbi:MAG: hypothetical protein KA401_02270 [Anaerolineae bacterium]|nr:hypothetical protein [Anaerolineae bacterium]
MFHCTIHSLGAIVTLFYRGNTSWSQDVVADTVETIIPDPSIELLESVETACVPAEVVKVLPATSDTEQDLSTLIDAVRHNANIPAGCRAELLAIVEALRR